MASVPNPTQRRHSIHFKDLSTKDDGLDLIDSALSSASSQSAGTSASLLSRAGLACRRRAPSVMLHKTLAPYQHKNGILNNLPGDISAGLIVAVVLIPQSLAYARLADLPAQYGLYASVMSLFIYPIFGSSPHVAVGPTALMGLLTAGAIDLENLPEGTEFDGRRLEIAFRLAFIVGAIQILLGVFNAGTLVNFLSNPMLNGFTAAAALVIGSSQLGQMLGVSLVRSPRVYEIWVDAVSKLPDVSCPVQADTLTVGATAVFMQAHGLTIALAVINLALFWAFKWTRKYLISRQKRIQATGTPQEAAAAGTAIRVLKAVPNALIIVVLNIIVATYGGLTDEGVSVVGTLETGMPDPVNIFGAGFGDDFGTLLPTGFLMALIGFMESISVGKAMALRSGGKLDSNQELVGLGMANLVGAPFNTFPITGSFSRTTVNADAGAKTSLAGIVTGLTLVLAVFVLLPLFENLPNAALGSLIVFAVSSLIDPAVPRMLWRLDKGDLFVYCASFSATLLLGIELGIMIGAGVSLAKVLYFASRPGMPQLGRVRHPKSHGDAEDMFRSIKNFPNTARPEPGLVLLRFNAPLFFANAEHFQSCILRCAQEVPAATPLHQDAAARAPKGIVVDLSGCSSADSTALDMLEQLPAQLRKGAVAWRAARKASLQRLLVPPKADTGSKVTEQVDARAGLDEREPRAAAAAGTASARSDSSKSAPSTAEHTAAWHAEMERLEEQISALEHGKLSAPRVFLVGLRSRVRALLRAAHLYAAQVQRKAAKQQGVWHQCEVAVPTSDTQPSPLFVPPGVLHESEDEGRLSSETQEASGEGSSDGAGNGSQECGHVTVNIDEDGCGGSSTPASAGSASVVDAPGGALDRDASTQESKVLCDASATLQQHMLRVRDPIVLHADLSQAIPRIKVLLGIE